MTALVFCEQVFGFILRLQSGHYKMKSICRTLLFLALLLAPVVTTRAQTADQQSPDPSANPSTSSKPKKVWTNDNISTTRGTISVVGGSSHSGSRSNGATILNPPSGSVVHPGDVVHIDAALDPGISIIGPLFVMSDIESPGNSLSFSIPKVETRTSVGSLVGVHTLSLGGHVAGRQDPILATIDIDVEEPDMPVELLAGGNLARITPAVVQFYWTGMEQSLEFYARYPDGQVLNVTRSTYLTLQTANPDVAQSYEPGALTSVGPGQTMLVVTYMLGAKSAQISIPVIVKAADYHLVANPTFVDFGNQAVGTESAPQTLTITNTNNAPIKIFEIQSYVFSIRSGNCANITLPPGGSCSITITFAPHDAGRAHESLNVNSDSGEFAIPISGTGI